MKKHLTERQIIEYQFKLLSGEQMVEIGEHLKTCAECRKESEKLAQKFSALDLLRDEIKVSEELISKTLKQADTAARSVTLAHKRRLVYRWWVSAAAAVLVIAAIGIVLQVNRSSIPIEKLGEIPAGRKREIGQLDKSKGTEYAMRFEESAARGVAESRPTTEALSGRSISAGLPVEKYPAEKERPPFAPASAIELVTLPKRDNVQITIYNSADLTLVRERRNLTLKKGWNWLQFMWANTLIDPTSLYIEPLEQTDKIENTQLVFPAGLREVGRWLFKSEIEGQIPFEVTYFTSGLSWRAFYEGTLSSNEKKMKFACYVRVENGSGEDYENAQTRLIVGKVHLLDQIAELARRQWPYGSPIGIGRHGGGGYGGYGGRGYGELEATMDFKGVPVLGDTFLGYAFKPKEIIKEGLSEYFLYTIEGKETIPDKWGKRLRSFEVNDVNVTGLYKYDEERWGKQTIRFLSFANDNEHNLGKTPLPDGKIKIYSTTDSEGHLSYVGGANVKYIPVNEEVELNLGSDPLVTIEPILMNFKTENYRFDKDKNISGWDEIQTWKIKITNTRLLPVDIEITCGFGTNYWSLEHDHDVSYEKYDVRHARFKTTVPPRTKKIFNYTVTIYHGVREEEINQ